MELVTDDTEVKGVVKGVTMSQLMVHKVAWFLKLRCTSGNETKHKGLQKGEWVGSRELRGCERSRTR